MQIFSVLINATEAVAVCECDLWTGTEFNGGTEGTCSPFFSFCGVANELLLRIVCRTGRLKPYLNCMRRVIYFRSDRVSLLFMGERRVKARFSYGCTVAKATYIQWSKILTVCNIARVQAGYVL